MPVIEINPSESTFLRLKGESNEEDEYAMIELQGEIVSNTSSGFKNLLIGLLNTENELKHQIKIMPNIISSFLRLQELNLKSIRFYIIFLNAKYLEEQLCKLGFVFFK